MSRIAHINSNKAAKHASLSDLKTGTAFVKDRLVKTRLTYKELSLLLGIVVAAIILMVIWLNPVSAESSDIGTAQPAIKLQAFKLILQKVQVVVQLFL
jgi:hypothetical protein